MEDQTQVQEQTQETPSQPEQSVEQPSTPETPAAPEQPQAPAITPEMIMQDKVKRENQMIADFQAALQRNNCDYEILFHLNAKSEKMDGELRFTAK